MLNLMGYIDPASTALIWQILAGVFITLGVVFSIWWRKITTFIKSIWVKIFGGKKKKAEEKSDELDELLDEAPEKKEEAVLRCSYCGAKYEQKDKKCSECKALL